MNQNTHRFFVLTGGPGSGKTSVIDALQQAGYSRTLEAGRAIIQDQVAVGGRALPWQDRALFAELMLSSEMASYHIAEQSAGLVFFDRSVVDVVGYLHLCNLPLSPHFDHAVKTFRYNSHVFIAPPWEEIYKPDRERKQDFSEAVRTYQAIAAAYAKSGYDLIEIPRVSVKDRARFILSTIQAVE